MAYEVLPATNQILDNCYDKIAGALRTTGSTGGGGVLFAIKNAPDYDAIYTYDPVFTDNVMTIVHSSASLGLTITENFVWSDANHLAHHYYS